MTLVQLVYVSREAEGLSLADYRDILRSAVANNRRDGLTGVLVTARPFFVQCLEGRRSQVSALLDRLYRDPRHRDIQVFECREIDARQFADWEMRLIRADELNSAAVRRVCLQHGIDLPFQLGAVRSAQLFGWLGAMHDLFEGVNRSPTNGVDSPTLTA